MKETKTRKLIDRKELIRKHPALGARPHRISWLIRTGQIPVVRISARQIFFDEMEIADWIERGGGFCFKIPGDEKMSNGF